MIHHTWVKRSEHEESGRTSLKGRRRAVQRTTLVSAYSFGSTIRGCVVILALTKADRDATRCGQEMRSKSVDELAQGDP
jgi:hypothetical protein